MLLMIMRGAGRVMRIDRVHIQLIGHTLGLLQPVIGLHRRRLHSREMCEGLQSALIVRAVAGFLDQAMRRRYHLIVVRTVTGSRRAACPNRRGTTTAAAGAASRVSTGTDMMLQVGILRQHVVQVVRMMVMIVGPVAGSRGIRRIDGEQDSQIIASSSHGNRNATNTSLRVLVRLYLVMIVQVTMGRQHGVLMHLGQVVVLLLLMMVLMMIGRG